MRALICSRLDGIDSLEVGELPAPELRPGTVRVAVGASAVNFPDLLLIVGRYPEQPPLPFSPGMEVAGTVVEVAEDVEDFAVGDRVLGMIGHGGFAEEVVVSPDALVPMPRRAIRGGSRLPDRSRNQLPRSSTGRASVTARPSSCWEQREEWASPRSRSARRWEPECWRRSRRTTRSGRSAGAAPTVSSATTGTDLAQSARRGTRWGGRGLRPGGGEMTEPAFRSLACACHLVVGFASGSIPALPANLALLKGASLVGVFWGRFT